MGFFQAGWKEELALVWFIHDIIRIMKICSFDEIDRDKTRDLLSAFLFHRAFNRAMPVNLYINCCIDLQRLSWALWMRGFFLWGNLWLLMNQSVWIANPPMRRGWPLPVITSQRLFPTGEGPPLYCKTLSGQDNFAESKGKCYIIFVITFVVPHRLWPEDAEGWLLLWHE